jgi:hypothetical protein
MNKYLGLIFTILVLTAVSACSNGANPVTPGSQDKNINLEQPLVSESNYLNDGANPYRGVFGAWKVIIDPDTLTAEIEPARNAQAVGLIVDADLSQFLTVSPCSNCMRITAIRYDADKGLILSIGLKHPFANGVTRPDLHGFDVRLIFLIAEPYAQTWNGINMMHPDGLEETVSIAGFVSNADGYTSHWDELPTDERYFRNGSDVLGNVNPFVRYFEDYSTGAFDPLSPTGQNVMKTGSSWETQDIYIQSMGCLEGLPFYIVADVAYGQSAVLANRQNPQYYLPAFHRTEPWRYEYWIENNHLDVTDPTSTVDVVVQVFDWQQGATVDPAYPNPANLAGIPESSNVLRVELLAPSLQNTPVVTTVHEAGSGTPTDPLRYRLTLTNQNLTAYNCVGLLAIRDELYGQTGRLPIPVSPAGFPYSTLDILDYTLYDLIWITYDRNEPYDFDGEFYIYTKNLYTAYDRVTLNGDFFMDYSGKKFQYAWDYDYDGVTFNVDGTGMPSPEITLPYTGINDIGLRVQTNSVPPHEYTYTIPVYRKGLDGQMMLDTGAGTGNDAIGYNLSSAVGATDNYYYVAFTSEAGGKRDVWLSIIDQDGNANTQNLTASLPEHCLHPVINVINDGVNDGVYIVFDVYTAGTDWDLYSIYGNLDGTGFAASNIKLVSNTYKYNAFADLEYAFDRLLVYYWGTNSGFPEDVAIAYSDDYALTWISYATPIDGGTSAKMFPSAAYCRSQARMWVVWQDGRDTLTTGTDLYMAKSYLGLNFDPAMNISSLAGLSEESQPDAITNGGTMAIVYVGKPLYATDPSPRLKIVDLYDFEMIDFALKAHLYGSTFSRPTVSFPYETQIAVAYGTHNTTTNDLHAVAVNIHLENGFSDYRQEDLLYADIGNETLSIMNYYGVALFGRAICDNWAVENVFFYTDYTNGARSSPVPHTYALGEISVAKIIGGGRRIN